MIFLHLKFLKTFLYTSFCCSGEYDALGGRRCPDFAGLVEKTRNFTHIFVIVGDNDAQNQTVDFILQKFKKFKNDVCPSKVKFAGNMRRRDLNPVMVANNNIYLGEKLGRNFKSTKLIKRDDFFLGKPFHFDWYGQGYRHMAAMILSVFQEFVEQW